LSRFSAEDCQRIGVHTCSGSDRDSTHSAEIDYAELLPSLFELKVGNFYIALAGENDRVSVQKMIRDCMNRTSGFSSASSLPSTLALRLRKKFATESLRLRSTFRSSNWAPRTTAGSRFS
jgi:hypothetical protein